MTTTFSPNTDRSISSPGDRAGFCSHDCPECRAHLVAPHGVEDQIVACPACGQCVYAPAPWVCGITEWGLIRPTWPFRHRKASGWVGVAVGIVICGVALVPALDVCGRAGAFCLGMALLIEGLNRLLVEGREKADPRPGWRAPTPDTTADYGALKALFVSKNSVLDSLALCFVALTCAFGGAWILSWMMDGAMHPKLILCLLVIPVAIGYTIYRSVRIVSDRQYLVIREHGMHVIQGQGQRSFAWADVSKFTAAHLGDMIDEDAIEVTLRGGGSLARFTRAQFPHLERLYERIVQEASEHIESGRLQMQSVDRSSRS